MSVSDLDLEDLEARERVAGFVAVEGVVALLVGVAAIAFPFVTGLVLTIFLGWALIVSGIVSLLGSIGNRHHLHIGWSAASGILAIVAGLAIALDPVSGAQLITLIVGAWLVLDGAASMMIALGARRAGRRGWVWLVASAAFDWLLAIAILFLSPIGSVVSAGLVVGLDLSVAGAALLVMSAPWRRPASR